MRIRFILALTGLASPFLQAQSIDMEDVIVTARQQPQQAARLPLDWAAIEDSDLAMVAHTHINESFQRIAGGWITRGNGQESLTALRSPVFTGPGSCGAFYVAEDGISLRAPGFCNVNQLFDANTEQAQRVEVIKGPASALYGSGAMHGVINVLSLATPEDLMHQVGVEGGPHGYMRGKYQVGNRVGAHGFAAAINATDDDGYKDDSGFTQLKGTLRHDYSGSAFSTSTVLAGADLDQETAGFIQGFEAYQDSDRKQENPNPEAYRKAWSARLHSTIDIPVNEANSLSFTPYWRKNEMEFLQHFLPWQSVEENGHESFGLNSKFYHQSEWLELAAGIDLEYTEGWLLETQDEPFSPNQPAGTHYDYDVDASLASLWSQLDWDFSDRVKLSAGARYEYTNYDYQNRAEDGPACGPESTSSCRFYRPASREDDFNNWSLNAGLLFDINDSHAMFARASRGFRAPQATELYRLQAGQVNADLDSEQLSALDIGFRGIVGQFHYEVGGYYMNKDDVIFQDSDRQNISGAKTRHYGLDIALRWQLNEAIDLALDTNVARHQYDSEIRLLGSSGDIKGNDIDTAPRYFGSLRLGWQVNPGNRAELEWVNMASYYLEPDNAHEYDGHNLLNLRLTSQLSSRIQLGVRITNLTDQDYAERADFGFGQYRYFVGEPRSLYVQLQVDLAP
jgi:iron complex outermembrane receptor protein